MVSARAVVAAIVPLCLALGFALMATTPGRGSSVSEVAWRGDASAAPEDRVSYGRDVRPIITRSCLACHGFDPSSREADLRLDTFEFATSPRSRGRGPAIVPGDPEASLILERVAHHDPEERMPPEGEPLTDGEIEILRRWIEQGAGYEPHWSLKPVRYVEPPAVADRAWSAHPVDAFVRARLDSAGLEPRERADRRTLLRRLSFDLTGLPPTPEQTREFLDDTEPGAYGRLVDRLLASPHFGERWARHWLDLMRYAETYAHEFDYEIRHAYQYRDYVIRAFNEDVPYDRFVTEHIAGDLLLEPRRHAEHGFDESVIGTGFWWLSQGTHGPVDVRADEAERIDNQLDVLSKTFLATTVSCARCHDHKFDPIYTREYYALSGFIQSSRRQEAYLDPGGRIASAVEAMERADGELRSLAESDVRPSMALQARSIAAMLDGAAESLHGEPREGETPPSDRRAAVASFDGEDYAGWTVEGDAFTSGPTPAGPGGLAGEGTAKGAAFANTHRRLDGEGSKEADARTGRLIGEPFTIRHEFLHFLIGGGDHAGKTGLRLLVGGEEVASGTGNNSLRLEPRRFDVGEHRGSEAVVEIFDEVEGGWGNIRVDEIYLSDEPYPSRPLRRAPAAVAAERSLDADLLGRLVRALQRIDPSDHRHVMSPFVRVAAGADSLDELVATSPPTGPTLFDFADGASRFDEWFETGWAFGGEPTRGGAWRAPGVGWQMAVRDSADSGRTSDRLMGTLRSPTFEITHPYLAVLARGRGTARVIIDGFTMDEYNALLFSRCKIDFDHDEWGWIVHDTRKYIGHRAHFEIIDDRQDASVQIARALWLEEDRAPAVVDGHDWLQDLAGEQPVDASELALRYHEAVEQALAGAESGTEGLRIAAWLLDEGLIDPGVARGGEIRERFASAAADCPAPMRAMAMDDGTGEDEYVFLRGDHRQRGETAQRSFIGALSADPGIETGPGSGRLALAEKMLDESNPMPARVMVNRVWQHLFGRGIVETPDDFGLLGKEPTHPELLDHLAWRFRNELGWSVKELIRTIVLSETYRMASGPLSADAAEIDPLNDLLSTREIRRLDGESIRDGILLASGQLDPKMYGPSVPIHLTAFMTGRGRPGRSGPVDGDRRRSIYIEVRRNFLSPMMSTFDAPNAHQTMGKRSESNVPAQSLILLNDPFLAGQAALLAERLLAEPGTVADRLTRLYDRVLGRPPSAGEIESASAFLRAQAVELGAESGDRGWADHRGAWADFCHVAFNLKEFVFLR